MKYCVCWLVRIKHCDCWQFGIKHWTVVAVAAQLVMVLVATRQDVKSCTNFLESPRNQWSAVAVAVCMRQGRSEWNGCASQAQGEGYWSGQSLPPSCIVCIPCTKACHWFLDTNVNQTGSDSLHTSCTCSSLLYSLFCPSSTEQQGNNYQLLGTR